MSLVINKTKSLTFLLFAIFWILGVLPFLVEETLGQARWENMRSFVSVAADAVILMLGLLNLKRWYDWLLALTLLALTLYSSLFLNGLSLTFWANGIRAYLPMIFFLPILRYYTADRERFRSFVSTADKNLFIFLVLQFPAIVIQFLRYGAGDDVGGTLGRGGYSGIISGILYMGSFYLLRRAWDNRKSLWKNMSDNWLLFVLLLPSFLNETKVSMVYILLYAVCLIKMDKRFIVRLTIALPVIAALAIGGVYLYVQGSSNSGVLESDYLEGYVVGTDDLLDNMEDALDVASELDMDNYMDFPRGALYIVLPIVMDDEPHSWMWGYGLGHWKGGNNVARSKFYERYEWLLQGTILQGFSWTVEMGWLGWFWIAGFFYLLFGSYRRRKGIRDVQLTVFMALFWVIQIAYTAVMLCQVFAFLLIYVTYVSWHYNELTEERPYDAQRLLPSLS